MGRIDSNDKKQCKNTGNKMSTHELRYDFWDKLLSRLNIKSDLFKGIKGTDWGGIWFRWNKFKFGFRVANTFSDILLIIDQSKKEENKRIFGQLLKNKDVIEKDLGSNIIWEEMKSSRSCKIYKRFNFDDLQNKIGWGKLHDDMVEFMIKFEDTFKRYINQM